jgi:hypothetical protein
METEKKNIMIVERQTRCRRELERVFLPSAMAAPSKPGFSVREQTRITSRRPVALLEDRSAESRSAG